MMAASCGDNDYTELSKLSEELAIKASSSEVVLTEKNHAASGITLEWTAGTNFGSGNRINYTLELAEASTNFADPVIVKEGVQQVYNWSPSTEELNNLVINNFGITPGGSVSLNARVIATVSGLDRSDATQVASTSFTVTTYQEVTRTLYLLGDATPGGWSADNATEMSRTDNGIFTWTGLLDAGSLKFITTLGSFLPSYNNGGNGTLVLRTSDDQPDEKFTISEKHAYKIDVNLLDMTVKIVLTDGLRPPYDMIYLVGNETGWGFEAMNPDPIDPFLFRIGKFFTKGGEFKFGTSKGSWENMYKVTQPNAPYTDQSVEFVKGFDPDNKWFLKDNEINLGYKICFDTRPGSERMIMTLFTPYQNMYLVGDATPNGWSLDDATPMTLDPSDPNIFEWKGDLKAGEMKFSADKKSDWSGAWFMASEKDAKPAGEIEHVLFIDKSSKACKDQYKDTSVSDLDFKWKITDPGYYSITLNQLLESVIIKKIK